MSVSDPHTMYIHTYVRTYVRMYVRTYVHVRIYSCVCVLCAYVRTYVRVYTHTYIRNLYTCAYVHALKYVSTVKPC